MKKTFLLALALGLGLMAQTPAARRIQSLETALQTQQDKPALWADLALAFAKRARETADPAWYEKGHTAVARSLALMPGNFEAEKARVWLLLGQHQFAKAREIARTLNQRAPDDIQVYGFLVDANVELGDYAEAEKAAQWMLNLRPGAVAGLARAAYLRELFGDLEGSMQLLAEAYRLTPMVETEERSWLLVHSARLLRHMNRLEGAGQMAVEALKLTPDYHYALAELAEVRRAEGRNSEALTLFRKRYEIAPHPENLYDVGLALWETGKREEARAEFARFETAARAEMESEDNANRELIAYYAGPGAKPKQAQALAESELKRRQDVYTLAAYAQALRANGRAGEADKTVAKIKAVGAKDPKLALATTPLR
jgi:tetratricopeptide (TPR) repeat protein